MKTIQEMWFEFFRNTDFTDCEVDVAMRKAFFAGFNRAYNIMNEEKVSFISQYEEEMDKHSEEGKE